jgi:hypothetical protein
MASPLHHEQALHLGGKPASPQYSVLDKMSCNSEHASGFAFQTDQASLVEEVSRGLPVRSNQTLIQEGRKDDLISVVQEEFAITECTNEVCKGHRVHPPARHVVLIRRVVILSAVAGSKPQEGDF